MAGEMVEQASSLWGRLARYLVTGVFTVLPLIITILGVEELPPADREIVTRARRVQRFLSQPNFVAEQYTGIPGEYVPIDETVQGFREILEGRHDQLPEQAFMMAGSMDQVVRKAEKLS